MMVTRAKVALMVEVQGNVVIDSLRKDMVRKKRIFGGVSTRKKKLQNRERKRRALRLVRLKKVFKEW